MSEKRGGEESGKSDGGRKTVDAEEEREEWLEQVEMKGLNDQD